MTVETAFTALALIEDEPTLRLYRYRHALTGHTLYACFPNGYFDDMHEAPNVTESCLLYDRGLFTVEGEAWRQALANHEVQP